MYESISKLKTIFEINKTMISVELKRHLSPNVVGSISRLLPLSGTVHIMMKHIVYINVPINKGLERPKNMFNIYDVAYYPQYNIVCFFRDNMKLGVLMTPIGKITSNTETMKYINQADAFRFYYNIGL